MEGIEWQPTDAFPDEIPVAYQDDVVTANGEDSVTIMHMLRRVVDVKGDSGRYMTRPFTR